MTTSAEVRYTLFHPRWYRRRVSVWWWLKKGSYAVFVLRELTSVAVAFSALLTLLLLRALAQGPEAYGGFLSWMGRPIPLMTSLIALAFVLFHSLTWFHLAPKAIVARFRGRRVPDGLIVGLNYLAWALLSGGMAFLLLRG